MNNKITIINGDGIGPEIMDATIRVLDAVGAGLEYEHVDARHPPPPAALQSPKRLDKSLKG